MPDVILDISTHDLPINSHDIFGNFNKTALEIGFGKGEFIIELAAKNKDWNFIGIEIKTYRFKKAVHFACKNNIENLKLLHCDANIAVEQVFEDGTFDNIYINFPDPWPKDRHKKHRVINKVFLERLRALMKKGGIVEFVSDHAEYVSHTIEQFKLNPNFKNISGNETLDIKTDNRPSTKYEKQFIEEKKRIYYLTFQKVLDL